MENELGLRIYNLNKTEDIEGLDQYIEELQQIDDIQVNKNELEAAFGRLAGECIEFILSDSTQALLSLVEIGGIFWGIISLAKKANKQLRIGKKLMKPLALFKASKEVQIEDNDESVIWGPMKAELLSGLAKENLTYIEEDASGNSAYFMSVTYNRTRNRVRTMYYLISTNGELCASWYTQTFSEKVPDFLKPKG